MHQSKTAGAPCYRFKIFKNDDVSVRGEPLSVTDPEEVWQEASMLSCELIRDMYGRMVPGVDWAMEVEDPTGKAIYRFSFKAEAL